MEFDHADAVFKFNIDLTISSWVRLDVLDSNNAIFQKRNNDQSPLSALEFSISSAGNLQLILGNASDLSQNETITSVSTVTASSWKFVAVSIQLRPDAITDEIVFNIDSTEDSAVNSANYYFAPEVTALSTNVGALVQDDQPSGLVWVDNFKGFIYGIWIENVYQTGTRTQYFNQASCDGTCTSSACATAADECLDDWEFTEYADGQSCGADCTNIGCVRAEDCLSCSDPDCHLCFDAECTACTGYAEGDCTTCGQTANSTGSTNCTCSAGSVRDSSSLNKLCLSCHTDCETCTTGGLTNYSDCSVCNAAGTYKFGLPMAGGSTVYCANYCPQALTESGNTCTGTLGVIYESNFNTLGTTWANNGFTLDGESTTKPARNRGQYLH